MASNKEYWRQYYLKNKDRISAYKKARYQQDAEYRESIKQGVKIRSILYKASQKLAKIDKIKTVYGIEETPLSLKAISRLARVDYGVLRKWSSLGYIPPALYTYKTKKVYSESQAKYLIDFIDELKRNEAYLTYLDLKVFLKKVWAIPYKGQEFSKELIYTIMKGVSKYEEVKEDGNN